MVKRLRWKKMWKLKFGKISDGKFIEENVNLEMSFRGNFIKIYRLDWENC